MARDTVNGALLALGTVGAVAAAGAVLGRGRGSMARPEIVRVRVIDALNDKVVRDVRGDERTFTAAVTLHAGKVTAGGEPRFIVQGFDANGQISADNGGLLGNARWFTPRRSKSGTAEGSRAVKGIPDDAWIYTDKKGRRWATDGAATVREDAPALASSSKNLIKNPWVKPGHRLWDRLSSGEDLRDLIERGASFAKEPYPSGVEVYFNKRYGPVLKKASKVQISEQDFNALKSGYGPYEPATAFDKNGEPWALVMNLRVDGFGKDTEVVNQYGEPRTVKV